MALDEKKLAEGRKLNKARARGYGIGLLKGMAVTFKHLFKHNTVIQYPDEKQDLPARTRGVIALKEENCTVCMLCARECPDWCIYIDSHKEQLPPKREGGRPRKRNVLDRFAIDYALCMYCGICVEVCPYDALFWSREFEYAEYDIRELTHEKERLSDWMGTVLPPPELEVGSEVPGQPKVTLAESPAAPTDGAPAVAAGAAGPGSAQRPAPPAAATAAAESPEQAPKQPAAAATAAPTEAKATASQQQAGEIATAPKPEGRDQATEEKAPAGEGKPAAAVATGTPGEQPDAIKTSTEAESPDQHEKPAETKAATTAEPERAPATQAAETDEDAPQLSAEDKAKFEESPGPNVEVPHETPQPVALQPTEDAEAVYQQVLAEQLDKGSSPQVAEARAKVARVKAERGIKRGPTPIETEKMVPSAPTKGQPTPQEPSGAPEATDVTPDPGPVAPAADETSTSQATAETTTPEADAPDATATAAPAETAPAETAPAETAPAETESPAPSATTEAAPAASGGDDDPDAVFERVLAEEKAKGSSDAVAQGRAKAARVKAERAKKKAGG